MVVTWMSPLEGKIQISRGGKDLKRVRSSNAKLRMSTSGSPMQSIYEEDLEEVTLSLKGQVKFLIGAFSRLNESQEETNSTMATMEGKMSSMESAMTNLTSAVHAMMKAVRKMPVQEMDQFSDSSNPTSQVHRPILEHNRSVSMGFRARS
ncbi:unnamed protein product [Brassica rapa]|uniref:Uncharacterized protein n=1 Tax=Brassica campestris TaxID=3711 RepID=A0A8D9G7P3_BRACM|nr:unnamed protein product [Brassica rapa]